MKVVCIKQHSQGILTVGKVYEIFNTRTCACGRVCFDVDIQNPNVLRWSCGKCGCSIDNCPVWWISSDRFAPLEEKGEMFIEEFLIPERISNES